MGLSRLQLFTRLGRIRVVEPMLAQAFSNRLEHEWRNEGLDHHGQSWRHSLRGSQFPGDYERPCPRQFVYWLMGIPEEKATSRDTHGTAIVGEAVEEDNIRTLLFDGRVLSEPPYVDDKLGFQDNDHWLTVTPDIVVLPYRWNRPHAVEVKTKDTEVVNEMKNGQRMFDPKHRNQCLATVALINELHAELWQSVEVCYETWQLAQQVYDGNGKVIGRACPTHKHDDCLQIVELEPCRTGSVIYHSRERPRITHEWFFEVDDTFMPLGREVLREAIEHFKAGTIPEHPFGGKDWSKLPCKYCDFKKFGCKPDHQADVTEISESNALEWAKTVNPNFDVETNMKTVLDRWLDAEHGVHVRTSTDAKERAVV